MCTDVFSAKLTRRARFLWKASVVVSCSDLVFELLLLSIGGSDDIVDCGFEMLGFLCVCVCVNLGKYSSGKNFYKNFISSQVLKETK